MPSRNIHPLPALLLSTNLGRTTPDAQLSALSFLQISLNAKYVEASKFNETYQN
jgi:hypothetical protein